MKNKDIIILANGGFLASTGHSLPVEHFYKWHKFKRAVAAANEAIGRQQVELLKDCGIDPSRMGDTDEDTLQRFSEANNALLDEDCGISVKATIPFEFYKGLYDENKTDKADIYANAEVEDIILRHLFTEENDNG